MCIRDSVGLARLNLASGTFILSEIALGLLGQEIERIAPSEILLPDDFQHAAIRSSKVAKKRLSPWQFDYDSAFNTLTKQLNTRDLNGFGCAELKPAICAAGAMLDYVQHTQRTTLPHINAVSVESTSAYVQLDAATRRNLEIDITLRGEAAPTLYSLLNTTQTAMGARLLRHWLHHPLQDRNLVLKRHEAIAELIDNNGFQTLARTLKAVGDIERITARVALKTARPRDLSSLAASLQQLPLLQTDLAIMQTSLLQTLGANLTAPSAVVTLLTAAIRPEPSTVLREGGVIADGYDAELDELRSLQSNHCLLYTSRCV